MNRIYAIRNALDADLGQSIACYLTAFKAALYGCYKQALFASYTLMALALFNLYACPVTLSIIQDERLPTVLIVLYVLRISTIYHCPRLAVIGSHCFNVRGCTGLSIITFVGSITYLVWQNYQNKNPWYANVLKAWFSYNRPGQTGSIQAIMMAAVASIINKFPPTVSMKSPGSPVKYFSDICLH